MIIFSKKCSANNIARLLLFFTTIFLVACAAGPYHSANREYKKQARSYSRQLQKLPSKVQGDSFLLAGHTASTVNFNLRKPHFVIIHHTAQESCEKTLQTFIDRKREVSAHYVICKDGTVHHMLNDYFRAWHAGVSRWGNVSDVNSISIGVELDNNGSDSFPSTQVNALVALLNRLKSDYNIPDRNFIGHGDIAPGRKIDPNVLFPWQKLAGEGFGSWYGDTTGIVLPENFEPALALRIVGYDVSKFRESVRAFRRHYIGLEEDRELNDAEKKVLYSLMLHLM